MILLWFILGMLLAFAIARYNESNKLFWTLALSFILGFATAVMIQRTFGLGDDCEKQSKHDLTQLCPTQAPIATQGAMLYLLAADDSDKVSLKPTASDPVSQDYTAAECEDEFTLSEVIGSARDQPSPVEIVDTS